MGVRVEEIPSVVRNGSPADGPGVNGANRGDKVPAAPVARGALRPGRPGRSQERLQAGLAQQPKLGGLAELLRWTRDQDCNTVNDDRQPMPDEVEAVLDATGPPPWSGIQRHPVLADFDVPGPLRQLHRALDEALTKARGDEMPGEVRPLSM